MAKYTIQKQTTEKSETKHRQKKYFKASQIALLNGEISNKVKTVQRCLKSKLQLVNMPQSLHMYKKLFILKRREK